VRGGHCSRGKIGEVKGLAVRSLASFEPREVQEIVDQMPEATAVACEPRFDRVTRRASRLISQEPLGGRLKRGDRRAQLV
jgi:hypothetical protein